MINDGGSLFWTTL